MQTSLRATFVLGLIAVVFVAPAPARGQEAALLEPIQPVVEPVARTQVSGHLSLNHSDAGLAVGEYFSSVGLQLGATSLYFGLTWVAIVATQVNRDSPRDMQTVLITAAALAPPILALPSSFVAHGTSKRCPRERSWGWTYLAGVAGNALTLGAAGLFIATGWKSGQDFFPSGNELALLSIVVSGTFLTAGLEVLALNLSGGKPVAAAPMVLKDGAGVAVGGTF